MRSGKHPNGDSEPGIRQLISRAWEHLRLFAAQFIAVAILLGIVAAAVFMPLVSSTIALLVSTTGSQVVSNTDIIGFILSPAGVLMIVLIGILALTSAFVTQAGIMAVGTQRYGGEKVAFLRAVWFAIRNVPGLLLLALLQVVIFVLLFVPFAAIAGVIYMLLLSDYNINYYLTYTPPEFWVAVVLLAVLLLGYAVLFVSLCLRWAFAVPVGVFEGTWFTAALRRSQALTKGHLKRIAVVLVTWNLLMLMFIMLVMGALRAVGDWLLGGVSGNLTALIFASALVMIVLAIVSYLLGLVRTVISSLLVLELYDYSRVEAGESVTSMPQPTPQERATVVQGRTSYRWLAWGGAVLLLVLAGLLSFTLVESLDLNTPVEISAHRGYSDVAPENTLSAITAAADAGADFAEIDVQETADGVIVLLHDDDLMKVAGLDKNIWEVTYDEIKDLDVGSWFSPEFEGERLPTLAEAIDASQGRIKLLIELKYNGHDEDLANRVVQVVQDNDFQSEVIYQSLKYDGLTQVKDADQEAVVGYTSGATLGDILEVEADFLSVEAKMADSDLIASAKQQGKWVAVWTVNDRDEMVTIITRGAGNIITDKPTLAEDVRQEIYALSSTEKILLIFGSRIRDG